MHPIGAALCVRAAGEVGIREQVWLYAAQFVTNPAYHAMAFRGLNVTDKSVQLSITLGRPASYVCR